jgi:hypothetical protein
VRGLLYLAIAILLLIGSAILLVAFQPAVGASYPIGPRIVIYLVVVAGWALLLMGLFRFLVGPGIGAGAGILKVVAIVAICAVGLGGLFSTWIVHRIVDNPRSASSGDWDWDD